MTHVIGKVAAAAIVCGLIAGSAVPAMADRPIKPKPGAPHQCKSFLHGNTATATKKDKARKRARRKWEEKALVKAGWDFRKWEWGWGGEEHYHCSKKGSWWRCQAGKYPCNKITGF